MCRLLRILLLICPLLLPDLAHAAKPLEIFFIDVEGGQSTLVVSPSGQSLLIDTGWPGDVNADKILTVTRAAHIKRIDYLVITHFHRDHAGGVPDLAKRIPIGTIVDHGANVEALDEDTGQIYAAYQKVLKKSQHIAAKPGDGLPMNGLTVRILTSAGQHISDPLPGAGTANSYCSAEPKPEDDDGENPQSVGMLITYGKFRFIDLGDLEKKQELELVCPNNLVGTVDLYLATHHGLHWSNPKATVWALHPKVAIMNNGAHKGADPEAWQIIHDSPELQDLWQLHYDTASDKTHNTDNQLIANTSEATTHFLKVTVRPDGLFMVFNPRNGLSRTYNK